MQVYWLEQSEAGLPDRNDWLSAAEAARLRSLRIPKRSADWRLGRWTAKRAVAAYLGLPGEDRALASVEIRSAPCGAPEVFIGGEAAPAGISLSHRAGVALCAVALPGAALGCDLERIEPRSDGFALDYFTTVEQSLVSSAPAADRARMLALLWSAKESALKALREGLRLDTRSVIVTPYDLEAGCTGWRPLQVRHADGQVFQGWWRRAGELVRTVVSIPAPRVPVPLDAGSRQAGGGPPAMLVDAAACTTGSRS